MTVDSTSAVNDDVDDHWKILSIPTNVRFDELLTIRERFFGKPRITGSRHIFKTPWKGDPRINLQRDGAQAKPYRVKTVAKAIKRLEEKQ